METIEILTLVGGISKGSLNKKLFNSMRELAPSHFNVGDFEISRLPFFSQDIENDPPQVVKDLKDRIGQARAILVITPEYNRSFPGCLKNAIDWGSRPYGQNTWDKKAVGILGASVGRVGTFGAQHHLRQVFSYLNMRVLCQPEMYIDASKAFDLEGKLTDPKLKELLQKYWKSFERWIYQFQNSEAQSAA